MLQMVLVSLAVFCVAYILTEIGDRHGFSPLSKIARAFDPPVATVLANVPAGNASSGGEASTSTDAMVA